VTQILEVAVGVLFEDNVDGNEKSKIIGPSLCASWIVADREIKLLHIGRSCLQAVGYCLIAAEAAVRSRYQALRTAG